MRLPELAFNCKKCPEILKLIKLIKANAWQDKLTYSLSAENEVDIEMVAEAGNGNEEG